MYIWSSCTWAIQCCWRPARTRVWVVVYLIDAWKKFYNYTCERRLCVIVGTSHNHNVVFACATLQLWIVCHGVCHVLFTLNGNYARISNSTLVLYNNKRYIVVCVPCNWVILIPNYSNHTNVTSSRRKKTSIRVCVQFMRRSIPRNSSRYRYRENPYFRSQPPQKQPERT